MALPAKRITEKPKKQSKSKMGMTSADAGTGPAKKKLNRPIAGLQKDQMKKGADKHDDIGKANTPDDADVPKTKAKSKAKKPF